MEVQKFGIPQPPTKWWLVGIHCLSVTINKLFFFFPHDVVVTWAHYFPKKTLIYTFCTHFFHQVTNISDKKNYTSLNSNYNISRLVEIVKFFQVAKFVKENIIFVEMQYLFVYNVSKYLFCFFFFFQILEIHFWLLLFCTIICMLFESGFVLLSHWKV